MTTVDEIRDRLDAIDQGHLLHFFDELTDEQRKSLLAQIEQLNLDRVPGWVETCVLNKPEFEAPAEIEPPTWYPADPNDADRAYDAARYREAGVRLLREGKVAAFCVAGGQGTRLGWDAPKGTFPATPVARKPLFQVFAESIVKAQKKFGATIPFYVMTSPLNDADTRAFFEKHEYFRLNPDDVMFFTQGVMPSFDMKTGRILLADRGEVAVNPDGHGGSLKALYERGAIDDMKSRGVEIISYFQVDNPLVKVVDPLFIGLHAEAPDSSGEMSSKMVAKAGPKEKVGNFCRVAGRTTVIEYSDLPDELAHQTNEKGELAFRAGSIAIHLIGVGFVERLNSQDNGFGLPLHRAEKKVAHIDLESGKRIEPDTPNAVKLETFVFDALPLCESSIILEAQREEEFAPIKNAEGVDSADSSRRLQIDRAGRWLASVGVDVPFNSDGEVEATIEISPLTAIEPEDLREANPPQRIEPGAVQLL